MEMKEFYYKERSREKDRIISWRKSTDDSHFNQVSKNIVSKLERSDNSERSDESKPPSLHNRVPRSPPYIPPNRLFIMNRKKNVVKNTFGRGSGIKSYGIILFSIEDSAPKFLLYKRRDSLTYNAIIRGYYTVSQIKKFVSLLTEDERRKIQEQTFDVLWEDMWIDKNCKMYKTEFKYSKNKFESNKKFIMSSIETVPRAPDAEDYMWGFPKGKRNNKERNIDCAMREFYEEVKIPLSQIILYPHKSLMETYYGSNGKLYKTFYYPAISVSKIYPEKYYSYSDDSIRDGKYISEEAVDAKWFSYNEIISLFKTQPHRRRVVTELYDSIMDNIKHI